MDDLETTGPDYRPHAIERRDIHALCFEINNILRGGMARRSNTDPSEIGSQHQVREQHSYLDRLCTSVSDERLSKAFLHLAVYTRTFDDIMNAAPIAEQYHQHKREVEAQFLIAGYVNSDNAYIFQAGSDEDIRHEFHVSETRNIRRCCGHIIHAMDFRPNYVQTEAGTWSMDGMVAIEGDERGKEWYLELDAFSFLEAVLHLVAFHEERLS